MACGECGSTEGMMATLLCQIKKGEILLPSGTPKQTEQFTLWNDAGTIKKTTDFVSWTPLSGEAIPEKVMSYSILNLGLGGDNSNTANYVVDFNGNPRTIHNSIEEIKPGSDGPLVGLVTITPEVGHYISVLYTK